MHRPLSAPATACAHPTRPKKLSPRLSSFHTLLHTFSPHFPAFNQINLIASHSTRTTTNGLSSSVSTSSCCPTGWHHSRENTCLEQTCHLGHSSRLLHQRPSLLCCTSRKSRLHGRKVSSYRTQQGLQNGKCFIPSVQIEQKTTLNNWSLENAVSDFSFHIHTHFQSSPRRTLHISSRSLRLLALPRTARTWRRSTLTG